VLAGWVVPVLLFVASSVTLHGCRRLLSGSLLVAGLLQAVLMMLQYFGMDPFFSETTSIMGYTPGRMIGTIGYHNQALDFLVLCASGLILSNARLVWRYLGFAGIFVLASLTACRGGMMALLVSVVVVELIRMSNAEGAGRRCKQFFGMGVMFVFCVAVAISFPTTRTRILEPVMHLNQTSAVGSRLIMAKIATEMWLERPFAGWGAGEYARQYCDRLGRLLPEKKTHEILRNAVLAREAHNDVLQFLAEFGLVGFALVLSVLGLILRMLWKERKTYHIEMEAAGFVVAYMGVAGLVSFPCQTSMAGPMAGLILGACVAGSSPDVLDEKLSRGMVWWIKISWIVLFALALSTMLWSGYDLYLNSVAANPKYLAEPKRLEALIPHAANRYRSILGAAYASARDYAQAERVLKDSMKGYCDPLVYNNLGNTLFMQAKWPEALEMYKKWAACGIRHNEALDNLSIVYEKMGNAGLATATLQDKFRLWSPTAEREILRLAVLQLMGGQLEQCKGTVSDYEKKLARWQQPLPAEFENILGAAEMKSGQYDEAEKRFKLALEKNPALESAKKNLMILHQQKLKISQ